MKRCLSLLLTASAVVVGLAAQSSSDAPLRDFRLPVFNEQGHRVWFLRSGGVRVLSDNADRFELTTVHVTMLAGDAAGTVIGELYAPVARVDRTARTVSGEGQLHVIYQGAELFGRDWHYDADTKSVVIEHDVVVSFIGELGNLLQ